MPNMQNADDYNANPASLGKSNGPWTTSAEMTNGRGAMVGLVAMLLVEKLVGGPITGIFGDAESDELFANNYYDESFASQVETPAAKPAAFADFDATVVAPAPVAAEPAAEEYAAAVTAEPIRVEGAADEAVEAEAMAMGRAVSEQEEAAVDAAEAVAAYVSGTPVTTHFLPLRGMGPEESARAKLDILALFSQKPSKAKKRFSLKKESVSYSSRAFARR
jgi:hypothetical protein